MAKLRGEQVIAQCFKNEGVDTIFFMMGGPTSGTAGGCLDLGMKGIYVRHEQAAAMMAHAYARVTGRPGICITPSGPGLPMPSPVWPTPGRDATPIIAIGGSAPMRGTTMETFQEMDQVAMMRPVVKAAYRVDIAARIPNTSVLRSARRWTARRDPCTWTCPATSWHAKVGCRKMYWPTKYRVEARPAGDPALVKRAIEILQEAQRPTRGYRQRRVVVGGGRGVAPVHRGHRHSVLHHAAGPRGGSRGPSARVPGGAIDGVSRSRRRAGDWRARQFDAVIPARRRASRPTPNSSTSTSTARKSVITAASKSASSATPNWCCDS